MAALATSLLVDAGTPPTFGAASTSDTALVGNGHSNFVVYKNASGGSVTLTVSVPGSTTYGQPTPDPQITIANNAEVWVPLRKEYANPSVAGVGRCTLTLSSATGVTVAVVQVG